jgi:exonuclease III
MVKISQLKKFTKQIEHATSDGSKVIITGDANLCAMRWNETNYTHKNIANPLKNLLKKC